MENIQYDWKFEKFEITYNEGTLSNVINKLQATMVGTHTINDVVIKRETRPIRITFPSPSQTSFIQFQDITQETIKTWVESRLGQENINRLYTAISESIANTIVTPPPPITGNVSAPWENPNPVPTTPTLDINKVPPVLVHLDVY